MVVNGGTTTPLMNASGYSSASGRRRTSAEWECLTLTLSPHRNYKALGSPLDREAALENPLRDNFFEVADFIVENDPAVKSYLDTGVVDVVRWQEMRSRQAE